MADFAISFLVNIFCVSLYIISRMKNKRPNNFLSPRGRGLRRGGVCNAFTLPLSLPSREGIKKN
jgi:hypothetical protein